VEAAAGLPMEPLPVAMLGIDETRPRRVRWTQDETRGWRREQPLDDEPGQPRPGRPAGDLRAHPRLVLGGGLRLAAGPRPGVLDGIRVVAIDICAAYAHGVRAVLLNATVVVDHLHVQRLANDTVTKVRRG
jgi:transposase